MAARKKAAATAKKETAKSAPIVVTRLDRVRTDFVLKGVTPLVCNAMSEKIRKYLLLPPPKKSAGDKAATLKHDPIQEYRSSVYQERDKRAPTLILMPSTAFKNAICGVATDIPDAGSRAQLKRLTYVENTWIGIYGVPQMRMDVVRLADQSRTPDIRTRAIIPEWVAFISVVFTQPRITLSAVRNLVANAGDIQGIGDFRNEKGAGNFGLWEVTTASDPAVKRIIRQGGYAAQASALHAVPPEFFDGETSSLYHWWAEEMASRGLSVSA